MNIQTAQYIASMFATLDRERSVEILSYPDVNMSYNNFISLKSFFNKVQHRTPSVGELIFFDAFIGSISEDPEQHAATDVCTNDEHMAETLGELIKKYSIACPDYAFPCTVRQALEIGIRSVKNKFERGFSESEKRLFAEKSNELAVLKAILNGYSSEHCQDGICVGIKNGSPVENKGLKSRTEYTVAIIYDKEEKLDILASFAEKLIKNKHIFRAVASEGKNLFGEISKITQNLSLNADLLPLPIYNHEEILPYERTPRKILAATEVLFTDAGFGKHAIAVFVKKQKLKSICSMAKKHGLNVCSAITVAKDSRFRMIVDGYIASDLNRDIFRAARIANSIKINIPDQADKYSYSEANKIFDITHPLECVYLAKASVNTPENAFNTTISTFISPFVSAAYDGKNARNSELSVAICASLPFSDKSLSGISFATLLGLYRAVTELGIPVEDLSITSGGNDASISVALRVYNFEKSAELVTNLSKEELVNNLFKCGKLPDFEKIRALINGKDPIY